MRRLLVLLPLMAVVVCSSALVASAGVAAAPAPSTTGYTIIVTDIGAGEQPAADEVTSTTAAEPSSGALEAPDIAGLDVGALQTECEAQLATIDLTTGALTPLSAAPSREACAGDLTFAPDGTLYGILRGELDPDFISELVRFDTTTGAATVVGQISSFASFSGFSELPIGGLAFDAQGRLFAELLQDAESVSDPACLGADVVAMCLYQVNPANPEEAIFVGQSAAGAGENIIFTGSTLNASCTTMYSSVVPIDEVLQTDTIVTVDPATGAFSDLGDLRPEHFLAGQATDRAATLWALELEAVSEGVIAYSLATLNPAGGTPIDTEVLPVTFPTEEFALLNGFAIEPLDCAQPEPVVLQPTFTG